MIVIASLFWLQYFDLKDRLRPEPRHKLLLAFLLGTGAGAIAVGAFWGIERLGVPDWDMGHRAWIAVYSFMIIGPVEEGAKVLVAYLFVFRWREFDERLDGLVYPAAIALGFAALENFVVIQGLPLWQQAARAFALPLTHTLFAACWGYGIAHARLTLPRGWWRTWLQIASVVAAMFLHGLYDYLIFAHQANFWVGGLVLTLWSGMVWRAHRLMKAQALRMGAVGLELRSPEVNR